MTALPDFLGLATTLVVLGLVVAGVMKLFQIGADMQEIKQILKDVRRGPLAASLAVPPPAHYASVPSVEAPLPSLPEPGFALEPQAAPEPVRAGAGMNFHRPPTPEELVRAVHAQDFKGDDFPL